MRYLSVCSGIEAATVAWHPLGWTPAAFAEIDKFPRAVLAHHYPAVPLHGDFTTIEAGRYGTVDLLVGGTPCQDFSIAGLRAGIAGERGNLTLEFLRLAARTRARWIVWENVPGVLSSDGGRALGAFLGGLAELGYGFAYRVLDAQHFGLAQRRARVFVVGHLGDWRRAAAVLFERESLQGHPAPRREAGEGIARPITPGSSGGSGYRNDADTADNLIAGTLQASGKAAGSATQQNAESGLLVAFGGNNTADPIDVATAVNAHGGPMGRLDFESETFVAHAFYARQSDVIQYGDKTGPLDIDGYTMGVAFKPSHFTRGKDGAPSDLAPPLSADADKGDQDTLVTAHAFDARQSDVIQHGDKTGPLDTDGYTMAVTFESRFARNGRGAPDVVVPPLKAQSGTNGDPCHPLAAGAHPPAITGGMQVRRLTPRECERLQGFPDDYTLIPYRGRPAADGPRYKALGNSMAVPVMAWIGRRIAEVDAISQVQAA